MTKIKAINRSAATFKKSSDHKQIARQFLELVVAGNIDEAYGQYVSSNGNHHNPFFREGFPALQEAMKENHLQFPNKHLSIKHVIAEGDLVAVHSHILPRQGEGGIAAFHLFRFHGDKIVELWDIGQPVPGDSLNQDGMF